MTTKRRNICCLIVLWIVFLLVMSTACTAHRTDKGSKNQNPDAMIADETINQIIDNIQNKNTSSLISLFSKNALINTEDANDLCAYFEGNCISYDNWGGPNTEIIREGGQQRKELYATYDIHTEVGKYRIAFLYIAEDTVDPENVGIWSMYIINWDDDTDPEIAYRGDQNYLPGIHIGIKNELPDTISNT